LNVDDAPVSASQYSIMSIPTLIIFKGGEVVDKIIGVVSKETIEEKLKAHI
ncbi:thiol reductase thioredoxin, partial [bacterium]|nr:thiol reductase thioredoxin [bacterium]